jgi:membrane fusion protein (multidrug efflux system)
MFQMDVKPCRAQFDAARGALAEQQARLWTALANLKRVKPLAVKANAVSKKELDIREIFQMLPLTKRRSR